MFDPSVILILAPHTDDGELGCGGSIARFIQHGKSVYYVAFSTCSASLPAGMAPGTLAKECKEATGILGIKEENTRLFDFDVRSFPGRRQEILEKMIILDKEIKPGLVFIPSSTDRHQDHATVYAEATRAFKKCSILGYELPWNQSNSSLNYFISLRAEHLSSKIAALKAYASQSQRPYMQENFTRSLAVVRGVQAGVEYAEAFEVYRIIT